MRRIVVVLAVAIATSVLVAACSSSGSSLTGKAWQWTASTTTAPASQSVVPDPTNYTIEFKAGGVFAAKADCNNVQGSYTTTGSNGITIVPGPSTQAACGPNSLGGVFIASLAVATSYAISNGQLVITNAPGTMTFK